MSSLYSPSMASRGSQVRAEMARGMRAALPVMLGFVPFALVLGAQAAQKGLSVLEVPMMTGMNFAGGSEFTAVRLWTSPPHIALIVLMSLLVNARHILMGAALAPRLRHVPLPRALAALFLMCDESWAVGLADAQRRAASGLRPAFSLAFYLGAGLPFYLAWVAFTTCGAALGPVLGDVQTYGFAMAFPAVFLVLLRGMWKGFAAARPWLVSLIVAALVYLTVPGAWYVAAGALSGLVAAWFLAGEK